MEVKQVFHMNGGLGETSYAMNSAIQHEIISKGKQVIVQSILDLFNTNLPESLCIADLGCSSGPNTFLVVSMIMDAILERCLNLGRPTPELSVFLNDLPANDFNTIFQLLPGFYENLNQKKGSGLRPCYIAGMPGSFYGRLFPKRSLHFVHTSSSLHWLSRVPPGLDTKATEPLSNKGKIYISKTSPPCVLHAYLMQFHEDFSLFLKSRGEEVIPGGRMVLSFGGRRNINLSSEESYYQWEFLAQALGDMVSEGIIEVEKVDSLNVPYYAPCPEEVKCEIEREGSFIIDRIEIFEIDWDVRDDYSSSNYTSKEKCNGTLDKLTAGKHVAQRMRAVVESLLESHFGGEIIDDLFRRYGKIFGDHLLKKRNKFINLVISLIRKT